MPLFPRMSRASRWIHSRYAGHPLRVATAALQGLLALHVFWKFGYSVEPTLGASMLPTIEVMGDHVLISKKYRRGRGIQVGDIIGFNSVYEPGESVIKRVLGMPGDYVLRDSPDASTKAMIQVKLLKFWLVMC
jgi:mitochondrial inner membrane protease subunit 1